jgi:hypothetical protein
MPFPRRRSPVQFSEQEMLKLESIRKSRTEEKRRTLRAAFLLDSLSGQSDEAIAQHHHVSRSTVVLCIQKFLQFGLDAALGELPRPAQQWRFHRFPTEVGQRLSGAPSNSIGVGQPFRAHFQRDARLPADHAATLRFRVYTETRLVAKSDRESIQQNDAYDAPRNPRSQQARADRPNSSIFRGDQRGPRGVSLEVQNERD